MARNKFMDMLSKIEGTVTESVDPFQTVLRTVSPSVNAIFGRGWGLPLGFTAVVYGPPKCGKTVFSHLLAGHLHMTDPEALVVKFDTEFRGRAQLNDQAAKLYGVDLDRLNLIENNSAKLFDEIEKRVAATCEAGGPVKLVIIDSLYGISGRREAEAESVEKQIIGDHAATVQNGLKRILPIQRKYKFALLLVDQVRSEMDTLEQMRGNKFKMRASFAVQHHAEYFIKTEWNRNKDGRTDMSGNEFLDDFGDETAKKFKMTMVQSSMGPAKRVGEYTFDFKKGIVNVHEEVFEMAKNYGILNRPNNIMYEFGGRSWRGESAMLQALAESPDLQQELVKELMHRDQAGGE